MTENAFYPLFLAVALAARALARAADARCGRALLLGACLVAYLTRQQALALLPALLTAPFLVAGRDAIRRYAPALRGRRCRRCSASSSSRWRAAPRRSASSARTRWRGRRTTRSARWRSGSSTTSPSSTSTSASALRRAAPARADVAAARAARPDLRRCVRVALVLARARGGDRSPPSRRCGSRSGTCSTSRRSS